MFLLFTGTIVHLFRNVINDSGCRNRRVYRGFKTNTGTFRITPSESCTILTRYPSIAVASRLVQKLPR